MPGLRERMSLTQGMHAHGARTIRRLQLSACQISPAPGLASFRNTAPGVCAAVIMHVVNDINLILAAAFRARPWRVCHIGVG